MTAHGLGHQIHGLPHSQSRDRYAAERGQGNRFGQNRRRCRSSCPSDQRGSAGHAERCGRGTLGPMNAVPDRGLSKGFFGACSGSGRETALGTCTGSDGRLGSTRTGGSMAGLVSGSLALPRMKAIADRRGSGRSGARKAGRAHRDASILRNTRPEPVPRPNGASRPAWIRGAARFRGAARAAGREWERGLAPQPAPD